MTAPPDRDPMRRRMKLLRRLAVVPLMAALLTTGCGALDEQERRWVFQPSKVSWGGGRSAIGMEDVWMAFTSRESGQPVKLHGLWLPQARSDAPTMLYLHGARWDVRSSASRMRRMHELGFSVLGVDYRGFGQSTDVLPSETFVNEDAHAAWDWLGARQPAAKRYLYGHSLGSAIAVRLATEVDASLAPAGVVLEGAFPSIPAVLGTFRYGWLPLGPLVTQRFDAAERIGRLRMPVLIVHGSEDALIPPALGRALYERAAEPKRFVLVEGGSHHDSSAVGRDEYRQAIAELFGLPLDDPRPQSVLRDRALPTPIRRSIPG